MNYYFKLSSALKTILSSYAIVVDNVNKNFEKVREEGGPPLSPARPRTDKTFSTPALQLSRPKGSSGSNSMSMF